MPSQVPQPVTDRPMVAVRAQPNFLMRAGAAMDWFIRGINPQSWFSGGDTQPSTIPPEVKGRAWDYPPQYNLRIRPKDEGLGPQELRGLAQNSALLQGAIRTVQKQLLRHEWHIQKRGAKAWDEQDDIAKKIEASLRRPDRNWTFEQWWATAIEDQLVLDNPSTYLRLDTAGKVYAIERMDPGTIMFLIGSDGRTPFPPEASYKQILKGQPIYYTMDEMICYPRFPSSYRVYGMGEVEQVVMYANISLRRDLHKLAYYTEGNVPDAIMGVGEDWSPDQIEIFERNFNSSLQGNLGERRKMKFIPGSAKDLVFTKDAVLKDEADDMLFRLVCWFFDISPQALVREMNRATSETQKESSDEEGQESRLKYWKGFFDLHIERFYLAPGYEFNFEADYGVRPKEEAEADQIRLHNGAIVLNGWRDKMGLPPVDGGDVPIIVVGNNIFRWSDIPNLPTPQATGADPGGGSDGPHPGDTEPDKKPDPNASGSAPKSGESTGHPGTGASDAILATRTDVNPADDVQQHHDLDTDHVNELAAAMEEHGWDGPPILIAQGEGKKPYLLDGHHRFFAARKVGLSKVPAFSLDWGELQKVLDAHFDGKLPAKLAELDPYVTLPAYGDLRKAAGLGPIRLHVKKKSRQVRPPDPERVRSAQSRLKAAVQRVLSGHRREIIDGIVASYVPRDAIKAATDGGVTPQIPPDEERAIDEALARLDWSVVADEATSALTDAADAQARAVLGQLGIDDGDILGRVSEQVIERARARAAELVGMRRTADGNLIPNPDAKWRIDETTRQAVRDEVSRAFSDGLSREELAGNLERFFDEDRADKIAFQEVRMAQTGADLDAWRASGVVQAKRVLLSDDHDKDDECDDNADAGDVPLTADFPSGHDAPPFHVNCHCSWAAVTDRMIEEGDEGED